MDSLAADYTSSSSTSRSPSRSPSISESARARRRSPAPGTITTANGHGRAAQQEEADESEDGFEVISVTRAAGDASPGNSQPARARDEPVKAALEAWVSAALAQRESTGIQLNETVRANRNFRNPSILQKMIAYCGIDEYASNVATLHVAPHECYDALAERQRAVGEKG